MNDRLLDSESREKIINELDRNFFVEAGAGSGKTHCLVERMVNLIKTGKAKIENISAVTFTRKAAAELKERFQIRLEESLKQNPDAPEKANIKEALSNLEQVFIGTIHSFCSKILRERPVEAGVDPGFTAIEEEEDAVYADNAWSGYIEDCYQDEADYLLEFFEGHGVLPDDLKDAYKKILQFPDVEIITADVLKPDFTNVKKNVSRFILELQEALPGSAHENGWDELQKLIRKAVNFIENGYLDTDVLFVRMLKELDKSAKVTQNRWPDGDGKIYEEEMEKFRQETVRPAIRMWQEYLHKPCADFIKKGAEFYGEWRKEHSILNFTDLLIMTSGLLRTNHEVRSYFKNKFTHVLVDEFQDTDPIQAELFLFLTGTDEKQNDWREIIPVPGSLFLVGDPKQSIYRFRRADISIYNTVKNIFNSSTKEMRSDNCGKNGNNKSEVLSLFSNFRSLPFMKNLVKEVFKPIFPQEEDAYQAKYFALNTVRSESADYDCGVLENNIEKVPKNNSADVAAIDAGRIAGWIDFAVNHGGILLERTPDEIKSGLTQKAVYSDFLILSRKRENLGCYAKALENKSIPYDISGGRIFNKSTELKEILKLFKAVEDDRDPVALVTALRGLFFGISDDRLYDFSIAGGRFYFYSAVPEGFAEFGQAYGRLLGYKKIVEENEPITAAEMIIEDLGIILLAVSEEEGLTKAGNIYKALELLRDYKQEEVRLFFDLVKNLEELLKVREVESLSLLASRKDVVRIMNLHKAKGLEAPVVILADPLGEVGERAPELHVSRAGIDTEIEKSTELQGDKGVLLSDVKAQSDKMSKGYFCIIKSDGSYGSDIIGVPPEWDKKAAEETKYESAERKRLDYVAVTRAKNILVVSTYREGSRAKAWEILYAYLKEKAAGQIPINKDDPGKEMEIIYISPAQWKKEKEEISGTLKRLTAPGYRKTSVTTEAKDGYLFGFDEASDNLDEYPESGIGSFNVTGTGDGPDSGRQGKSWDGPDSDRQGTSWNEPDSSKQGKSGDGSDSDGPDSGRQGTSGDWPDNGIKSKSWDGSDSGNQHKSGDKPDSNKQDISGFGENDQVGNEKRISGQNSGEKREKAPVSQSWIPGLKWGMLAHKVIELVCRENIEKLKTVAGQWAVEAGLENKSAEDLTALAEKFICSELFKRISLADEKLFEVPFALTHEDTIVHGIIDLVFREGNKWVIVDYKTDDFEADKERKSVYLKQLELYKKYWEKISRTEVSETILHKI